MRFGDLLRVMRVRPTPTDYTTPNNTTQHKYQFQHRVVIQSIHNALYYAPVRYLVHPRPHLQTYYKTETYKQNEHRKQCACICVVYSLLVLLIGLIIQRLWL